MARHGRGPRTAAGRRCRHPPTPLTTWEFVFLRCGVSSCELAGSDGVDALALLCNTIPTGAIPAGSFIMGSPSSEEGRQATEGPQHSVTFSRPFAVGRFSVTHDEWNACLADGGCNGYQPPDWGWARGQRPVTGISWNDAKTYLAWLSRKTGKPYRLLSEAEREYATRAGATTSFWWGSSISTGLANYNPIDLFGGGPINEYRMQTLPVDNFELNPWGLAQVHGNIWEWVEDCLHETYTGAPSDGSAWTTGNCGSLMIRRGGSWFVFPQDLRSAKRGLGDANDRLTDVGFRVPRSIF
jgi:formylglycine-generating enzyme required for sulfatase activity